MPSNIYRYSVNGHSVLKGTKCKDLGVTYYSELRVKTIILLYEYIMKNAKFVI